MAATTQRGGGSTVPDATVFDKTCTLQEAVSRIRPGATIMVGGFLGVGTPDRLLSELARARVGGLTIIANDSASPGNGIGRLISAKLVRKLIASHIGTNPETQAQMNAGDLDVELVPQGTLVERIRAGGAGLGGILTQTGLGTVVEEGKRKIEVEGRQYLLETALRAELALIAAFRADRYGNLLYRGTARNFNPAMATAADLVIAEPREMYELGDLDPDRVETPGIYVDLVVRD